VSGFIESNLAWVASVGGLNLFYAISGAGDKSSQERLRIVSIV
jgi:hypothetical protein